MQLFDRASKTLELIYNEDNLVYDLDSYFAWLQVLVNEDRSFIRIPLDEEPFYIKDDVKSGRRVIVIPEDVKRNGLSVQGDESAEIVFFEMDRYYDNTDLMGTNLEPIEIFIQWETSKSKNVSPALVDQNGKPFLADNGKIYFGWVITSEITENKGNVSFSVRFVKRNQKVITFNLNTQPAMVQIKESINYTPDLSNKDELSFVDVDNTVFGALKEKNGSVIERIQNSDKHDVDSEFSQEPLILQNAPTSDNTVEVTNEKGEVIGTYYKMDLNENGSLEYRIFAIPSGDSTGFITYGGKQSDSAAAYWTNAFPKTPQDGGNYIRLESEELEKYLPDVYGELNTKVIPGVRYFVKDKNENNIFSRASIPVDKTLWDEDDRDEEDNMLKYWIFVSPLYQYTEPGYYYATAINSEGKRIPKELISNRIFIPWPTPIDAEANADVLKENEHLTLVNGERNIQLNLDTVDGDTVKYVWYKDGEEIVGSENSNHLVTVGEAERALFDSTYRVVAHTERNNKNTKDQSVTASYRVTDTPHNFNFVVEKDGRPIVRKIEAENLTPNLDIIFDASDVVPIEDGTKYQLNFVSDKIKFRWMKATKDTPSAPATDPLARDNDDQVFPKRPEGETNPSYKEIIVENGVIKTDAFVLGDKIPQHDNTYYCEIINVVGDEEADEVYTEYIKPVDNSEY